MHVYMCIRIHMYIYIYPRGAAFFPVSSPPATLPSPMCSPLPFPHAPILYSSHTPSTHAPLSSTPSFHSPSSTLLALVRLSVSPLSSPSSLPPLSLSCHSLSHSLPLSLLLAFSPSFSLSLPLSLPPRPPFLLVALPSDLQELVTTDFLQHACHIGKHVYNIVS